METGTFRGITARSLASVFDSVTTIELSAALHERASVALSDLPQVETLHGHSVEVLGRVANPDTPTLYFFDGHWSAGETEGIDDECPVLEEIRVVGSGHPDDCTIIDNASLFTAAPPPPHDRAQWPMITEVFDAIRSQRPEHVVTLLKDQVIAVPWRAKPAIDAYSLRMHDTRYARLQARVVGAQALVLSMLAARRGRIGRRLGLGR